MNNNFKLLYIIFTASSIAGGFSDSNNVAGNSSPNMDIPNPVKISCIHTIRDMIIIPACDQKTLPPEDIFPLSIKKSWELSCKNSDLSMKDYISCQSLLLNITYSAYIDNPQFFFDTNKKTKILSDLLYSVTDPSCNLGITHNKELLQLFNNYEAIIMSGRRLYYDSMFKLAFIYNMVGMFLYILLNFIFNNLILARILSMISISYTTYSWLLDINKKNRKVILTTLISILMNENLIDEISILEIKE